MRGLPRRFSLAMHGIDRYKQAIGRGIELAQIAGKLITASVHPELVRTPSLSCVVFRRLGWKPEDYRRWTYKNLKDGFALVTPTRIRNGKEFETVTRFCFINPDTNKAEIQKYFGNN